MSSVILELQNEMVSSKGSICDLLRKAYIIARKLRVTDFEKWLNNELNGYKRCE